MAAMFPLNFRPVSRLDDALAQHLLDTLDVPRAWPAVAADVYAPDVRWRCPRRGLEIQGREAVVQRWLADLAALGDARPVTLRRAVAGRTLVHESSVTFVMPAGVGECREVVPGTRVELHCTRLLTFAAAGLVDELVLEHWTPLPPAA